MLSTLRATLKDEPWATCQVWRYLCTSRSRWGSDEPAIFRESAEGLYEMVVLVIVGRNNKTPSLFHSLSLSIRIPRSLTSLCTLQHAEKSLHARITTERKQVGMPSKGRGLWIEVCAEASTANKWNRAMTSGEIPLPRGPRRSEATVFGTCSGSFAPGV